MGELGLVGRRLSAQRESLRRKRLARVSQSSTPLCLGDHRSRSFSMEPWKSPWPLQSAPPLTASLAVVPSVYKAKNSLKPGSGIDSSTNQHFPDPELGTMSAVKFLHVNYTSSWQQRLPKINGMLRTWSAFAKGKDTQCTTQDSHLTFTFPKGPSQTCTQRREPNCWGRALWVGLFFKVWKALEWTSMDSNTDHLTCIKGSPS